MKKIPALLFIGLKNLTKVLNLRKVNGQRTLLLSGLATVTLIITLIETGFLSLEFQFLIAQIF